MGPTLLITFMIALQNEIKVNDQASVLIVDPTLLSLLLKHQIERP